MVIGLHEAFFFFAGFLSCIVLYAAWVRSLMKSEWSYGFCAGSKHAGADRRGMLKKAIDYHGRGIGSDPEAVVASAKIFESYIDGTHLKSSARLPEVAH